MSHLLEVMGRGLISGLAAAFRRHLSGDNAPKRADEPTTAVEGRALEAPAPRVGRLRATSVTRIPAAGQRGNPRTADEEARVGAILLADEEFIGARRAFERGLTLDPEHVASRIGLACVLDAVGRTSEAVEHLRIAQQSRPDDAAIAFGIGFCCEKIDQVDAAVTAYEEAVAHAPNLRNAHERLAAIAMKDNDVEAAIAHYEHMCATEPEDAALSVILADLYAKVGNDERAIRQFRQALKIRSDCLDAHIKLGTCLLRQGKYAESAQWLNKAVEINDEALNAYVGLAVAQHQAGHYERADASLEMAAAIEPNTAMLFSETARLFLKAKAGEEAAKHLDPRSMTARAEQIGSPAVRDLTEQAIARHVKAIEERPTHADLHYRLGLLLRHQGCLEEAIASLRRAVEINPNYTKALIKLGMTLHESGQTDEAIGMLTRAVELDPRSGELNYQLGLMFADQDLFGLAVEQFDDAIRKDGDDPDYHANLALALQNMGLIDRATYTWQRLCEILPDTEAGRRTFAEAEALGS